MLALLRFHSQKFIAFQAASIEWMKAFMVPNDRPKYFRVQFYQSCRQASITFFTQHDLDHDWL